MMKIETRKTFLYLGLTNGDDFGVTKNKRKDDPEFFPPLLIPHTVIPRQIFFNQVGNR
jgi:hypothetical protein